MKNLEMYVPKNLDVLALQRKRPRAYYSRNLKEEKLLYICHALVSARYAQRRKMDDQETRFANVCATTLDKVVHNYKDYLEFLLIADVIETDNHYIEGQKCRGFCFKPPYSGQPLQKVEVSDFTLRKAIRKAVEKKEKETKKALKNYGYLTKWWYEPGLEVDVKGALNWIEEYQEKKLSLILGSDSLKHGQDDDKVDILMDTCEDFKRQILAIHSRNFNLGFSGLGHRFYTPISNLKKELRAFLTYKGQPLVELDKKNSQPYFSLILLNKTFWQSTGIEPDRLSLKQIFNKKDLNAIVCGRDRKQARFLPHAVITLLENEEALAGSGFSGFQKYIEFVTGDFYQHMENIFKPKDPFRFVDRAKVKKEVLQILYMDPKKDHYEYFWPAKTFEAHFPFVYWLFSLIKRDNHPTLANILQRIESFLFLDVICKRIGDTHPDIPLFTIHDCILTTLGNQHTVQEIIEEELSKWVGYPATLTSKVVTKVHKENFV